MPKCARRVSFSSWFGEEPLSSPVCPRPCGQVLGPASRRDGCPCQGWDGVAATVATTIATVESRFQRPTAAERRGMSCRRAGCACSLQAREARRSTRSRGSATSRQRPRSACGSHPSRVTLATRLVTLPKIGPDGGDRCRLDRSVRRWFTTAVRRSVRVRRRSRPQPQETRACTCSGCGPPSRTARDELPARRLRL